MKAWEYAFWRTNTDVYDAIVLAKAEKDCRDLYNKCKHVTKTRGLVALTVPIKFQDKIRAMVMMIYSKAIPMAMYIRRRAYHIDRGGVILNNYSFIYINKYFSLGGAA